MSSTRVIFLRERLLAFMSAWQGNYIDFSFTRIQQQWLNHFEKVRIWKLRLGPKRAKKSENILRSWFWAKKCTYSLFKLDMTSIPQASHHSTDGFLAEIFKIVLEHAYLEKLNLKTLFPSVWEGKTKISWETHLWNFDYFPKSNSIIYKNQQK